MVITSAKKLYNGKYFHVALGLLLLYIFILFLEIYVPFFFTCDDNFHQFMPIIIEAYRGLNSGIFPTISPSIYMGYPTTSLGTYSILNPVLYICYMLGKLFFSEFYTIEIFAIVNLSMGFIATYILFRYLAVDKNNALFGALSFIISCPVIGISKNWYYFLPTPLFIALITYCTIRFCRERTYKSLLWLSLSSGVFFYMGNAQMWLYTLMLSAVLFFFLHEKIMGFIRMIPKFFLHYLLVFIIIFPLLFAQILTIENIERYGSAWANFFDAGGFNAILLPNYSIYCYNGAILLVISLFGYFFRESRVFFLLLLLSFAFSLGEFGSIYVPLHRLPFLNKFTHSYKFLVFVSFFSILTACLILKRYRYGFMLAVLNLGMLVYNHYNVSMLNNSFYTYPSEKPYPDISAQAEILGNKRFLPASLERPRGTGMAGGCSNINTVRSLNNNFPAYYGLNAFRGYNDYLMAGSEEVRMALRRLVDTPLWALQKFGVDYVVKCNDLKELFIVDRRSSIIDFEKMMPVLEPSLTSVYKDEFVEIFENKNADPMVFIDKGVAKIKVKYHFDLQGAVIYLNRYSRNIPITVNLLYRPLYKAYDDLGNDLQLRPDDWGRMVVLSRLESKVIHIEYNPFAISNYTKAIQVIKRKFSE